MAPCYDIINVLPSPTSEMLSHLPRAIIQHIDLHASPRRPWRKGWPLLSLKVPYETGINVSAKNIYAKVISRGFGASGIVKETKIIYEGNAKGIVLDTMHQW